MIGFWRNLIYFDKIPMGLRIAPYICQRVTNSISYIMNKHGHWLLNYVDDFISADYWKEIWEAFYFIIKLFKTLGLQEAKEKCIEPTQEIEFLGTGFNSQEMVMFVIQSRLESLLEGLEKWINKISVSRNELESLIGKLSFISNGVKPGYIFLARL